MGFWDDVGKSGDSLPLLIALAESAPVGVQVYDSRGYSLYVNEQFKRTFGATPPPSYCVLRDEIVRGTVGMAFVERAFAGEPTVAPAFWYDPRVLTELSPEDVEYVREHGKRCAIETHHIPVKDGDGKVTYVLFLHKDVTGELFMKEERERALKERDDARALIQGVLDQTRAVIYIKDLGGKYLFVNSQYCRIFDRRADEILGRTDYDLFPADRADRYRENDLRAQASLSHLEAEETAIHADGAAHVYLSLKFPLHDSCGALFGICGISTDMTEFRKAQDELNALKRIQAVGLLAGGVAHNFNNLLGIIQLISDTLLLGEGPKRRDWKDSVRSIKDAVQRAAFLTRQLLAFGRRQSPAPCPLDLATTLTGVSEILRYAVREDIQLSIESEPSVWPVLADPLEIEQVLANLCLNARDALPRGGELRVSLRNRLLSGNEGGFRIGRPVGEYVELAVADNGIGMDGDVQARIFEPFFTTKEEGQGTGLGLSTVLSIVRESGGDIAVESAPGRGTVFRICLPRAASVAPVATDAQPGRADGGRGETVLLIEDEAGLRQATAHLLREAGYAVIEARDAKAAVELWPTDGGRIDLIVTDVVLPGMDGFRLVDELESRAGHPLKALFVSAYASIRRDDERLRRGTARYLQKPYSAQGLLGGMRELLDRT